MLDEPHAGLDEEGRALLDGIVRAAPSEGRTVLIASHELDHTRPIVDREVVLDSGRAAAPEATEERRALASERTAASRVSRLAESERVIR